MAIRELRSVEQACAWLVERGAAALTTDSRKLHAGDAFIAWPGYAQDGRRYVAGALEAGAAACLVEAEGVEPFGFEGDPRIAAMPGLKAATGPIASRLMGAPSDFLKIVATTGTNGKTSTAWWTAQALAALGHPSGFIGTLGVGTPPQGERPMAITATGLTTPDPVTLHATLRRFVEDGFIACGIEASSIGIAEHRLDGVRIAVALFTNFTRDHLDYHGSMTAYWHAKQQLFAWPGLKAAVINLDDDQGAALARYMEGGPVELWTYSTVFDATLRASAIEYVGGGLQFQLHEGDRHVRVSTTLIGDYNAANLLAVIGGLRALGIPLDDAARVCTQLTPVPGRMQRVVFEGELPEIVVDYAHTPDALEKALLALRPLALARGGTLWCVFGCGGNRDATKRPLMGGIAQRLAQHAVVTSDNPRHEAPSQIIAHITAGMKAANAPEVIEDRRAAIAHAVRHAAKQDVVLVAGKGHEDYQEIAGQRLPFSDVEEAEAALRQRRSEELAA
jgi:UDP-N-acetylmuramoyl-L-alanyl-D-glutamate--2,6-diaminopimelate ligase